MKILNEVYGTEVVDGMSSDDLTKLCRVVELVRQNEQIAQMERSEQLRNTIVDQFVTIIKLYDTALKVSFPKGAYGEASDLWNKARLTLQPALHESEYKNFVRHTTYKVM
jgi:hypothetical protein